MNIADSLLLLNNTKAAIKSAIEAKGVTVGSASFATYPDKIAAIPTGGTGEYVRPSDWLVIPMLTATDQKFVGLHAVFPDANYVALSAAGAYTVDWGDGTVESISAGVTAQHEYNSATYDTSNTTLCVRGYKQAMVTVTPQVGQSFTALNLQIRNSELLAVSGTAWLDVSVAGASLATLTIGGTTPVVHSLLEVFTSIKNVVSTFTNFFSTCSALSSVPVLDTSSGTNFQQMFSAASSIRTLPIFNTSKGTTFSSMLSTARSLTSVPALDFTGATTIGLLAPNATSISDINIINIGVSLSVAGLKLTAVRLNEIFRNLKTTTGQTITITNCPGAATCDRTIATSKGWTVTG